MLISPAYAQAAAGGDTSSMLAQLAPIALILVVFYFLLFRPQQQKAKQHRTMLDALRRGDRVVTGGGLIGTVAKVVNNDEVLVDLAENMRVRVVRSTITQVLAKPEPVGKESKGRDDKAKGEKIREDAEIKELTTVPPATGPAANDGSGGEEVPPPDAAKTPAWRRMLGLQ